MTRTLFPKLWPALADCQRPRGFRPGRELSRRCLIDFPLWCRTLPRWDGYVVRLKSKAHALMQYLP